ncbi:hypothetical protein MPNT_70037 [Candidatus Methylacidithermus pantelleriae]|uniref:Uncharacterized protein n=1 Tax=Candidatus Methylacidithermus pantelleriae TaxID=2744239 RepID=A0A8J2BVN5_9BACT|nr:hypothetical protein MPNT_70037 [Candidatus Methylacidithermus pantelleriae]
MVFSEARDLPVGGPVKRSGKSREPEEVKIALEGKRELFSVEARVESGRQRRGAQTHVFCLSRRGASHYAVTE